MPRLVLALLILGAVAISAALAWFVLSRGGTPLPDAMPDSSQTSTRALDPFSAIAVSGTADVTLVQGNEEKLVVAGSGTSIRARVERGTLQLSSRDGRPWWESLFGSSHRRASHITVTYKNLDSIDLSGAVRLSADGIRASTLRIDASGGTTVRIAKLQVDDLRFGGSGALKADLQGQARSQRVSISGAGEYRAGELASDDVSVSVSGVGSVVVRANKTLRADISGAGSVEYLGNPEVHQSVSGVGRVKRRDPGDAGDEHHAAFRAV